MKTLIFFTVIFTFIFFSGCSTTTYFNLKATYPEYIEEQLNNVERDSDVGVEVSLLLNNGSKLNGELLSVRDSIIFLCTEYSAQEEELASLMYPIYSFATYEIKELTIEGNNWVLVGIAAGTAVGAFSAFMLGYSGALGEGGTKEEDKALDRSALVFSLGIAAGWAIGYALSTEEYVIQEIPFDYNWSILKPLVRYPDEEPEYLKVIK